MKDDGTEGKEPSRNEESSSESPADTGAAITTLGEEAAWLHIHAPDADGRAPIRVQGEWLDDEPGHVTLSTSADGYGLQLSLEPDDARSLASKLTRAASYAESDR